MSLLCGYIGERDDTRLARMADSSKHLGLSQRQQHHWKDHIHLIYTPDQCSNPLAGVASDERSFIALIGMPLCPGCQTTQELLLKIEQHGLDILNQLTGSYVGLISHDNKLTLFRDKAGRRTLFYTDSSTQFSFASESKILSRDTTFSPALNPSSLAQYLALSYVPGENTMLRGLKELKSGNFLDTSSMKQRQYFKPELDTNTNDPLTRSEWIERFHELFDHSIEKTMPSTMDKIAVFLSGGIDSSIVTASLSKKYGAHKVKAFGIHFGKQFPNELEHIRAVAAFTGVDCEEVEVNPKSFLPCLHEIIENLNDPIGDPVTMPNYLLAKHVANQGYHGVYNGEGGDPLFGGPKNMTMLLHHWYGNQGEKNHREKAYLASYRRGYEEINHLLTPEWKAKIDEQHDLEASMGNMLHAQEPQSFLKKLLLINMRQKGAHLILPKVERMLGSHGITPLSPLFDESLIELCMQLPGDLILKNGIEKVILKEAFRGQLPDSIIDRPKSGMRVPVHYWLKGDMKRYAKKILSKKRLEQTGIFDHKRVKQLLNYETNEGPGRYGIKLWMLLTFELWRQQTFDN